MQHLSQGGHVSAPIGDNARYTPRSSICPTAAKTTQACQFKYILLLAIVTGVRGSVKIHIGRPLVPANPDWPPDYPHSSPLHITNSMCYITVPAGSKGNRSKQTFADAPRKVTESATNQYHNFPGDLLRECADTIRMAGSAATHGYVAGRSPIFDPGDSRTGYCGEAKGKQHPLRTLAPNSTFFSRH